MHEDLDTILASIQQKFEVHFAPMTIDGHTFHVLEIDNMKEYIDGLIHSHTLKNPLHDLPLWAKVWTGSLVLGRHLRTYKPEGKNMLELGCGIGVASLVASHYGFAHIDATDINEDALLFARANVLRNNLEERIAVERLDIGAPSVTHADRPIYDIIAASELLYLPELHTPILNFVSSHLAKDGSAVFCTEYIRRQKSFTKKAKKMFSCTEGHIAIRTTGDQADDAERHLYVITILTKQESTH